MNATDPFAQILGTHRGDGVTCSRGRLVFVFDEPLDSEQKTRVNRYVGTRLDAARPRAVWRDDATLVIDCARPCPRDTGVIRLHVQHLAGIAAWHGPADNPALPLAACTR